MIRLHFIQGFAKLIEFFCGKFSLENGSVTSV